MLQIVAVGAHLDDIELFMAGLLIMAARAGHRVTWIVATHGAAGAGGRDADLAERRLGEAEASADLASASLIALSFPDGRLAWQSDAAAAMGAQLELLRPDLVVTHSANDYHPDHRAVADLVGRTAPLGVPILWADTMLGLHFVPEILVDISEVFDAKLHALAQHESQAGLAMVEALQTWNRFRGLQSGGERFGYAEAYAFDKVLGPNRTALLDRIGLRYLLV